MSNSIFSNILELYEKPKIKLVIFDLDKTLIDDEQKLYEDSLKTIKFLHSKNIKIAIASYNGSAKYILRKLNMIDYFDSVYCVNWQLLKFIDHKHNMLSTIIKDYEIKPQNILFIDDMELNIKTAKNMNILTHHINSNYRILLPLQLYDFIPY